MYVCMCVCVYACTYICMCVCIVRILIQNKNTHPSELHNKSIKTSPGREIWLNGACFQRLFLVVYLCISLSPKPLPRCLFLYHYQPIQNQDTNTMHSFIRYDLTKSYVSAGFFFFFVFFFASRMKNLYIQLFC